MNNKTENFYGIIFKNEKGFFTKSPSGKVFFIDKNNKEQPEEGNIYLCIPSIEKENFGFIKIINTNIETEVFSNTNNDTIWIKNEIILYEDNYYLYAIINAVRENIYPAYEAHYNLHNNLKECGYNNNLFSYLNKKSFIHSLDINKDKELIIKTISDYIIYMKNIDKLYIKGNHLYISKSFYGSDAIDIVFFNNIYGTNNIPKNEFKPDDKYIDITDDIFNELLQKHISISGGYIKITEFDISFNFKTPSEYSKEMDPQYPEWIKYEEWANNIRKSLTSKNIFNIGKFANPKYVLGYIKE